MEIPINTYSHSLYSKYNQDCGPITIFVNSPSFMSLSSKNFELNFEGLKPGTYPASILVQLRDYPSISITEAFNITLASN